MVLTKLVPGTITCLGLLSSLITLIVAASMWSERAVDDWYDFRQGRSSCALLNRSAVPFRNVQLSSCGGCPAPSGSAGSLGSSCSAYMGVDQSLSPYADNGAVPSALQGNPVCETGESACCREECETCRSCTGSGKDRTCTSRQCNCRCVESGPIKCVVTASTQYEARLQLWLSDMASHPNLKPIPLVRGVYETDLTTPAEFATNTPPRGRQGFSSAGAALQGATFTSMLDASATTGAAQMTRSFPDSNCFTSVAFVPQGSLADAGPWYSPSAMQTSPSFLPSFGPSTILLSDEALRAQYVSRIVDVAAGPEVPLSSQQVVSKGDLRFSDELLVIPEYYWTLFVIPGFLLAISMCCAISLGLSADEPDMTPDNRLSFVCMAWAPSRGSRAACVCWALVVIPTCVFVPMLVAVRAAREDSFLNTVFLGLLGAWLVGTVFFAADFLPNRPPWPFRFPFLGLRPAGSERERTPAEKQAEERAEEQKRIVAAAASATATAKAAEDIGKAKRLKATQSSDDDAADASKPGPLVELTHQTGPKSKSAPPASLPDSMGSPPPAPAFPGLPGMAIPVAGPTPAASAAHEPASSAPSVPAYPGSSKPSTGFAL